MLTYEIRATWPRFDNRDVVEQDGRTVNLKSYLICCVQNPTKFDIIIMYFEHVFLQNVEIISIPIYNLSMLTANL